MKQTSFTLLLTVLLSMYGLQAFADFDTSTKVEGYDDFGSLYYYLDNDNNQAEVTSMPYGEYRGDIVIPSNIIAISPNTYEERTYSVTSIGRRAFSYCSGLTSITIPNSVTSIGTNPFYGCTALTSVKVASGNTIYDSRGDCNAIIETASNTLIDGCKNTVIPNSVTSIGRRAFSGCHGLTSITIPNSVTTIGESAFSDCSDLTSITIPSSVTSISDYVFEYCSALTSVTVLNPTPVAIAVYTFTNRANATLYVPQGSKAAYKAANYWKEFKEIIEIDVTGIDRIMSDGQNNAKIYALDGKRIDKPQKGINIIGGKKVVVK